MATATQKRTTSEKKGSVHWDDAEKAKFEAVAIQLLRQDPSMSRLAAIQEAQRLALPRDRQRVLDDYYKVKSWFKLPPDLEATFSKDGKRKAPPPAESKPVEVKAPTPASVRPKRAVPPALLKSGSKRADGFKKVFWKPHEQLKLARATAMALHQGHTKSRVIALQMAQTELDESRRRHLNTVGGLPWFHTEVDRALADIHKAQTKLDLQAKKARELEERQQQAQAAVVDFTFNDPEQAAQARAAVPVVPPPPAHPASLISDGLAMSLAGLRSVLVTELAGIFREALVLAVRGTTSGESTETAATPSASSLATPIRASNGHTNGHEGIQVNGDHDEAPPAHRERTPEKKAHRLSVLVAGLKGSQKGVIEAEFGHILDLRYCGSDQSKDHLRSMTESAEVAVAYTDFLSHSHTDIMKARSSHFIPTGGGMSTLKDTLRSLAAETRTH